MKSKKVKIILTLFVLTLSLSTGQAISESSISSYQKDIDNLKDPNLKVRLKAVTKLAENHVKEATDELINMLKNDEEYKGRMMAAVALMQLGSEKALNALMVCSRVPS